MTQPTDILNFWFGELEPGQPAAQDKIKSWWEKNPAFDQEIKDRFGEDIQKAALGHYQSWEATPEGRLALIILFDQFTRNVFRNTPESFAYDAQARQLTHAGIESGHDMALHPAMRYFLYMPLMHSEDLADHDIAVQKFEQLVQACEGKLRESVQGAVPYEKAHRDIIERFGRYPHRNQILGRVSTPEEEHFLTQPGSSF